MGQPGTVAPPRAGLLWYRVVVVLVTFTATWGSLVGSHTTGTRRTPARASAPAALSLPGDGAAGSTVRPDVPPSPMAHPSVGADTSVDPRATRADAALSRAAVGQGGPQLTAAAQGPRHRAAAVYQPGGVS